MMITAQYKIRDFSVDLEKAEKNIYIKAYAYYRNNQSATAKSLGISRTTFITKMKRWGELK